MKSLINIVLILLLGLLTAQFFPWWFIAPLCLAIGFGVAENAGKAFALGFFSVFLLWAGVAAFTYLNGAEQIAMRMGVLLGDLQGGILIVVTGLIGGLIGGLALASGSSLRNWLAPRKT